MNTNIIIDPPQLTINASKLCADYDLVNSARSITVDNTSFADAACTSSYTTYTAAFKQKTEEKKKEKEMEKKKEELKDYEPERILRNGPVTVVFWKDKTKTRVRKSENSTDDPYTAFCAALAKKIYGNNSRVKKILDKKTVESKDKKERKDKKSMEEEKVYDRDATDSQCE